jgi:hypothetical protein
MGGRIDHRREIFSPVDIAGAIAATPGCVYNSPGPHPDLFTKRDGAMPHLLKTAPNRCPISAMATA